MSLRQSVFAGLGLAIATVVAVLLGDALAWRADQTILLGMACGGLLGIAIGGGVFWRLLGFLFGFAVTWASYPLRAGFLPDSSSGRAVAAVLVLLLVVALVAVTGTRVPLWSALVGVAAMAGAYEAAFTASPPDVLSTSPTWASSILLTTALGFAATVWFGPSAQADEEDDEAAAMAVTSQGE
jgi:MFS family permease